jgi:hypothetical protein
MRSAMRPAAIHETALGVSLPAGQWVTVLTVDLSAHSHASWSARNVGATVITDSKLEVSPVAMDAPDEEWFDHPQQAANLSNIAVGAWGTGSGSEVSYRYHRLRMRSTSGSIVNAYVDAR